MPPSLSPTRVRPRSWLVLAWATALAVPLVLAAGPATARPAEKTRHAQALVDAFIDGSPLADTTPGVAVVCTADGAVWAEHDADRLLNPASGTKLLTTAAALDRLPLDARWATSVHGDLDGATVRGDLVLVGRGDPRLSLADLGALADSLVAAGVASVQGDLVVDATAFADPLMPPAFDQKSTDASYRPAISAAGANHGAVTVSVSPAAKAGARPAVAVEPASDAVVVTVRATTVAGKDDKHLTVTALDLADGRTAITVDGRVGVDAPRVVVRRRVADPGVLSGHILLRALTRRGVVVDGRVRLAPEPRRELPVLAQVDSAPLRVLVADINTWSNNSMAETLFKLLGADGRGAGATWQRAAAAVTEALHARGLPRDGFRIVNGSGLYDATHVSPRALVTLLVSFLGDGPKAEAFRASLPVAGETGTLNQRLRTGTTRGKVRAKTGTLDTVVSLTGYVPAASGCLLALSVIINDATAPRTASLRREVDRLIVSLSKL